MKKILCMAGILMLFVSGTCRKDKAPPDVITIQGFVLTDGLGNVITTVGGNTADDWQIRNWSELSATEQSFLNFSDNINLANTSVATLQNPIAYPNPVAHSQLMYFGSADSVKLKMAIVDSKGHILKTYSSKIKGNSNLAFDFSDTTMFPSKKSLRYYYSFSANGALNFKAGYGDVKICRNSTSPVFADCFQ